LTGVDKNKMEYNEEIVTKMIDLLKGQSRRNALRMASEVEDYVTGRTDLFIDDDFQENYQTPIMEIQK